MVCADFGCGEEAGAVEGFGGGARRVPRSLASGMCGVCIMAAVEQQLQQHMGAAAVLSYHVAVRTSQEGREYSKQRHSRWSDRHAN